MTDALTVNVVIQSHAKLRCDHCFFMHQWTNLNNLHRTLDGGGNAYNKGLKEPFRSLKSSKSCGL